MPKTASACAWHSALTLWRRPGSFSPQTAGKAAHPAGPSGRWHPLHAAGGHGASLSCPGWAALPRVQCLHLDCHAVHAGGLEQDAEHPGGPFRTVGGNLAVPAAGSADVGGEAPQHFPLGVELLLHLEGIARKRDLHHSLVQSSPQTAAHRVVE